VAVSFAGTFLGYAAIAESATERLVKMGMIPPPPAEPASQPTPPAPPSPTAAGHSSPERP
jgi:hypothetical protein